MDQLKGGGTQASCFAFWDQDLKAEAHETFTKYFVPLEESRKAPEDGARKKHVMYVANQPVDGKDGLLPDRKMHFHTDQRYYRNPAKITSPCAMEVPGMGGGVRCS